MSLPTKATPYAYGAPRCYTFDMGRVNRIFVETAMTSNKPSILFRMQPELRAALEQAANDQNRSLSNLVETLLAEWAKANGYLKAKPTKPMRA